MNLNKTGLLILVAATVLNTAPVLHPVTASADTIITNTKTQGTLTITKKDNTKDQNLIAGATYTAYKIMNLTPGATAGAYASYSIVDTYKEVLKNITPDTLGNYSAVQMEGLIQGLEQAASNDTAKIESAATTEADGSTVLTLDTGWYLIRETNTPTGVMACMPFLAAIPTTNNVYSPDGTVTAEMEWDYDIDAVPKSPVITVDKQIINGQAGKDSAFVTDKKNYTGRNDTAAEGDLVNYEITAVIPEFNDSFFQNTSPKFEFSDTLSRGLTILNSEEQLIKVFVNDKEIQSEDGETTNFVLTAVPQSADTTPDLTLVFTDDFLKNNLYKGKPLSVKYFARVNDQAVMNENGNTNNVLMTYSNNPASYVSVSPVPDDNGVVPDTRVYTYGITVDKFAEDGTTSLPGAKFKLFKDAELTQAVKIAGTQDTEEAQPPTDTLVTDENGFLSFERLDAGTYYLKEVAAPAAYSLLTNPVKVEIIPTTDAAGKITDNDFLLKVDGTEVKTTEGEHVTKLSAKTGIATIAIENHKGFTLPATGGSGILFTVSVSAAGLLAVTFLMLKSKKKED